MLRSSQTTNKESMIPTRKKKQKFNPNRAYIDRAVEEYLRKGGRIDHVNPFSPGSIIPDMITDYDSADDFLMGA